jgi:hypothetical protein
MHDGIRCVVGWQLIRALRIGKNKKSVDLLQSLGHPSLTRGTLGLKEEDKPLVRLVVVS